MPEEQSSKIGNGFKWLNNGGKGSSTSSGGTFGIGLSKGPIPVSEMSMVS